MLVRHQLWLGEIQALLASTSAQAILLDDKEAELAAGERAALFGHPIFAPARALLHSVRHASMIADAAARLSRAV